MSTPMWFEANAKWPVEHVDKDTANDICETVRRAAQTETLMIELRRLFQTWPAMRELHQAMDSSVRMVFTVQSSRKYTRFKFPRARGLEQQIEATLLAHGLLCDTRIYPKYLDEGSITTLRIGQVDEDIIYTGEA